ncbi:MAG TPA: CocE/NonD family hydrolase [Flavobacterium sp.]|uniref:CocE/NonD family hydrolase n=1 Tax=Flavobacterium sp. TaxID=239 RepID=UPI002CFCEE4C|nr:CocE/NonD family hydrolase [Flavobacterium sp.]HNP32971.1 CocE/NonD family hydrolase [Flavobacterium sp.]
MKFIFISCVMMINTVQSQQIDFPRNQHKDSVSLAIYMPVMAKKIIPLYKKTGNSDYKDNLFRVKLVAKDYKSLTPLLREIAQEEYGDSTKLRALGIAFRWYGNTMMSNPKSQAAINESFEKQFAKLYPTFDAEGKLMVDQYYEKDLKQLKNDLDTKLKNIAGKDKISIDDAVKLCRFYCSYIVFSSTLPKAKEMLKAIDEAKYISDENVVLTMKDGGTIALTIVRPKNAETPLPVILKYNIYAGSDKADCKEAASKGYVGIVANTRGKRLSKDDIEPFEHDAKDAYEIIDWISRQSWCNGKIGMFGGSYLGFSQWSAAKYKHPALKTIVPQVSVGVGIDYPMHNGVFMSYMLRWIHFVSNNKLIDMGDFGDENHWNKTFKDYYTSGTPFRQLDNTEGRSNTLFQRWLSHPTYDSFWQNMTPQKEEFANIDIPILTTTGYYDDDQLGAMYYYKQYQKWNKNDNYYLIIGPYDHSGAQGYPKTSLNDYKIDEVANIPIQEIVYQWFDYTLKGGPKPEILKDKINYQLMGANIWQHAPSLEKMHNDELTFYISNGNKLTTIAGNTDMFVPQEINFKDRSDYKASSDNNYCGFAAIEPKTLPEDKNLMVLESEPLTEPLAITGNAKAYFDIEINKKDLDITFQLYEKKPDGTYFALSNNLERASLAKDRYERKLLIPNQKQNIPFENNFMACRQLQKGSRIVILLGVNKSADWQINYGTGKDVSDESIKDADEPLRIKWFTSSKFVIPVTK